MNRFINKCLILNPFRVFALVITLALGFLLADATSGYAQERQTHVVAQGETLFSISRQYNVSVEQLREWNRLSGNQINIGQRLIVSQGAGSPHPQENRPAPQTTSPPVEPETRRQTEFVYHRVSSGETLFSLSRRYGVTVNDIRAWNNLDSNLLEIGQILEIRQSTRNVDDRVTQTQPDTTPEITEEVKTDAAPAEAVRSGAVTSAYYVVRSGDTLNRIASNNNTTVNEIKELNRLQSDRLAVGQILLIRRPQGLPSVATADMGTTPQGRFVEYEVRRGERVRDLLQKFEMTELELKTLNPEVNLDNLSQGQTISVLLPPNIVYSNPYREGQVGAEGRESENIRISRYNDVDRGRATSSGDLYNPNAFTAAHNRLSVGSVVYVENPINARGIFVLINDRTVEPGLKLSHAAFDVLGYSASENNTAIVSAERN